MTEAGMCFPSVSLFISSAARPRVPACGAIRTKRELYSVGGYTMNQTIAEDIPINQVSAMKLAW